MESQVATTPQELKAVIDELRRLIAVDHKMYLEYKEWLWPMYPNEWQAVKDALIIRSRWYRGEMLRAKHNVARYMRGEEPKNQRLMDKDDPDWVDHDIRELHNSLVDWIDTGKKTYRTPEAKKISNELTYSMLEMSIESLNRTSRWLEKSTYGG